MAILPRAFELYHYEFGEGSRCVVVFDLEAATERSHSGFMNGRRVILFFPREWTSPSGLPLPPATEPLRDAESSLIAALEKAVVACRFVGRQSYNGLRELVFQVEDVAGFERVQAAWAPAQASLAPKLVPFEGWKFFDEKIRPGRFHWQQIKDRQIVDALLKAGANPAKPHKLEHLFLGAMPILESIAKELEPNGFLTVTLEAGTLVMTKFALLEPATITAETTRLLRMADARGVDYDGWGTAVVK